MKTRRIVLPLALVSLASLIGCETAPKPVAQMVPIKCVVPTVTRMPETKESQPKGGVEIAVVPAIYKAVRKDKVTIRQAERPAHWSSLIVNTGDGQPGQVWVEETITPLLRTEPSRLQFTVRINNKLDRVFRGQGSVVQMNVAGKLIPFGDIDYKNFINGIVPPRNETEVTISGPAFNMLPEKGTIGIFLYDVVTATDVAGNTKEKQNYEWYFNYTTQVVEESAETKNTGMNMNADEYGRRIAQQYQDNAMRGVVTRPQ